MTTVPSGRGPAVTVLMSCYNAKRWLAEAVESVLRQSFGDFEFILIDDGSVDGTGAVIDGYARADDRVVKLAKPNSGLADSLNQGIAIARGEWIARLDADDIAEPLRLEEQMRTAATLTDAVLIGSGFIEIDADGQAIKAHAYPTTHEALVRNLIHMRRFFPHSSALYRTEAVRRAGGYNPRFRVADDSMLWFDLAALGRIGSVGIPLVRVRKHPTQVSNAENGTRQIYEGVAAAVSYLLACDGQGNIARTADDRAWAAFYAWIRDSLDRSGIVKARRAWMGARASYFAAPNRVTGLVRFTDGLVRSGHAISLVQQKLRGSRIAETLAAEWPRHAAAVAEGKMSGERS
jgi:glycosyltransferase involved in cell wall biosynthesis